MHWPGGNVTDPISRVLASSDGISSWTPLKPQHSNPNPNPNCLANQLWCIDFLTPPTPLIIPHRLPAFLESLMPLKNWCSIHARWLKSSLKHSIRFCGIFSKFKTEFYCISFCGTIASRHLVGRWFRDYHMCRLVFLCFFPRPRCFQIRGKRRWLRSSRWRLEFVLERWKSCQANFKNDKNKAFVINSNKRLFTQLFR